MARTKSKYRQAFRDGGRVDLAGHELAIPADAVTAPEAPAVEAPQPEAPQPEADSATAALRRQLDELKRSEELQRQPPPQHHQPSTREEKIHLWKQHGLNAAEERFLLDHPDMIDHSDMTNAATNAVLAAGIERHSPEYWVAVENTFGHLVQHELAAQPKFEPTPAPPPPAKRTPIMTAPVSRSVPDSAGGRIPKGRVTLTREEVEMAKMSGVSLEEYARGKQRLADEKESGQRQT